MFATTPAHFSASFQTYLNKSWVSTKTPLTAARTSCKHDGSVAFRCYSQITNRKTHRVTCVSATIAYDGTKYIVLGGSRIVPCKDVA